MNQTAASDTSQTSSSLQPGSKKGDDEKSGIREAPEDTKMSLANVDVLADRNKSVIKLIMTSGTKAYSVFP